MAVESQPHLTLLTTRPVISDFSAFDFPFISASPSPNVHRFKLSSLKPHRLQGIQCSIQTIMGKTALRSRIRLRYVKENTLLYTWLNSSSHYIYTTNVNQATASQRKKLYSNCAGCRKEEMSCKIYSTQYATTEASQHKDALQLRQHLAEELLPREDALELELRRQHTLVLPCHAALPAPRPHLSTAEALQPQ